MAMKLATTLIVLFALTFAASAAPLAKSEASASKSERTKKSIQKLGIGKDARVEVKLKDGTKVKGYVSEIKDGSFVVTNEAGTAVEVPYDHAKQVRGNNLSTGAKILIGLGVVVAVLLLIGLNSWD